MIKKILSMALLSIPVFLYFGNSISLVNEMPESEEVETNDEYGSYVKDGIVYSPNGVPISQYDKNFNWISAKVESFKVDYSSSTNVFWRDSTTSYGAEVNGFTGMEYNYDVCAMQDFFVRITDSKEKMIDNVFAIETCFIISEDEFDYWDSIELEDGKKLIDYSGKPHETVTTYFDRYDAIKNPNGVNKNVIEFPVYIEFDAKSGMITALNSKYSISMLDKNGLRFHTFNKSVNFIGDLLINLAAGHRRINASTFFGHLMTLEDYQKNYVGKWAWLSSEYIFGIPINFEYNYTNLDYLKKNTDYKDCNYVWRIPYPKVSRIKYINCWFKEKKQIVNNDGNLEEIEVIGGGAFNENGYHQVWENGKYIGIYDSTGVCIENCSFDTNTGLIIDSNDKELEDYNKQPTTIIQSENHGISNDNENIFKKVIEIIFIVINALVLLIAIRYLIIPLFKILFKKK